MEVFAMALNDFLKSRIPTARKIVKKLDKELFSFFSNYSYFLSLIIYHTSTIFIKK